MARNLVYTYRFCIVAIVHESLNEQIKRVPLQSFSHGVVHSSLQREAPLKINPILVTFFTFISLFPVH